MKNKLVAILFIIVFILLVAVICSLLMDGQDVTNIDDVRLSTGAATDSPVVTSIATPTPDPNATPAPAATLLPLPTEAPTPTPEPTPTPTAAETRAAELGLPAPPDIDINSWEYVLVNGDHSIDRYEPPELAYLNQTADETDIQTAYNANRCPVDSRIAQALLDMALGCKEAGYPIYLSSGYRSYSDQEANFQRICNNNGITDGKDASGHYITMPAGCSEHQTGLGCDITDHYREIKNDEIDNTDTSKWLVEHCAEYGFIHRFPGEKSDITGVMNEGWHFRYVGVEAAKYIMENNLCLEEFVALYDSAA